MSAESPDEILYQPETRTMGRGRWRKSLLWASLLVIIGCAVGGGMFLASRRASEPTIYALIEIDPSPAFRAVEMGPSESEFQAVLKTHRALVLTPDVLQMALRSSRISSLPAIQSMDDPIKWLMGVVRVDLIEGTPLLRISAPEMAMPLQAEMINAIAEAYASRANLYFGEVFKSLAVTERSLRDSLQGERAKLKDALVSDPHSLAAEAAKDQITVDLELWKKIASVLRMSEAAGGEFSVVIRQRAQSPEFGKNR